jgi:hypothetical protein
VRPRDVRESKGIETHQHSEGDEIEERRLNVSKDQQREQFRQALTAYEGQVTRCPPGKPRAPTQKRVVRNASVEWLKQNRKVRPIRDKKAERRKLRMTHAQQQRIAKRNAALLKRVNGKCQIISSRQS